MATMRIPRRDGFRNREAKTGKWGYASRSEPVGPGLPLISTNSTGLVLATMYNFLS